MPSDGLAPQAPELSAALTAALGVRSGIYLRTRFQPGPFPVLATLGPAGTSASFLLLDATEAGSGHSRLILVRLLPLDLGLSLAQESLRAWKQEWSDIHSLSPRNTGLLEPARNMVQPGSTPPLLPPLFFCPEKRVLISAVCPGCSGPRRDAPVSVDTICLSCGSPGAQASSDTTQSLGVEKPLRLLRSRVAGAAAGQDAGEIGAEWRPPCCGCDRRETCFPAELPPNQDPPAAKILVPISERPWGGILIEPIHLPLIAWYRLLAGEPWAAIRRDLDHVVPVALLDEVERLFREEKRYLTGPEAPKAFGYESLLLKLEALRQILGALFHLSVDCGHPHMGVRPDGIWVRVEPSDSLRSALWSTRFQLLDSARRAEPPGSSASGAGPRAPDMTPLMIPAGCLDAEAWIEGTCILKSSHADPGGRSLTRLDFLPHQPMGRPPVRGDTVELAMLTGGGVVREASIMATVEKARPEMCQVYVVSAPGDGEAARERLLRGHSGSAIRMKIARDHSLVDDLFALGTICIASLQTIPVDFEGAARFRDELAPRLRDTRPGGGTTLIQESLKAASSSRKFALQSENATSTSQGSRRLDAVHLDRDMLAKALALGMRLCGAVPAGYPCQNHEPVGIEERGRVYDTLLSIVVELGREVRERLVGSDSGEASIMDALGAYAVERASRGTRRRRTSWTRLAGG